MLYLDFDGVASQTKEVFADLLQSWNFVPAFTCNLSHVMDTKKLQAVDFKGSEISFISRTYIVVGGWNNWDFGK